MEKYKEAIDYINHVRKMVELVSINRVNKFLENNIILKEEKSLFVSLVQRNINNKLLEEKNYILKTIVNNQKLYKTFLLLINGYFFIDFFSFFPVVGKIYLIQTLGRSSKKTSTSLFEHHLYIFINLT